MEGQFFAGAGEKERRREAAAKFFALAGKKTVDRPVPVMVD